MNSVGVKTCLGRNNRNRVGLEFTQSDNSWTYPMGSSTGTTLSTNTYYSLGASIWWFKQPTKLLLRLEDYYTFIIGQIHHQAIMLPYYCPAETPASVSSVTTTTPAKIPQRRLQQT